MTNRAGRRQNKKAGIGADYGLQLQKMTDYINNFKNETNGHIRRLEGDLNEVRGDLGNSYDLINAMLNLSKKSAPTQNKFFDFCKNLLEADFNEMDNGIKITAILQYMEATFNFSDVQFQKLAVESFDKRNKMVRLGEGEKPSEGYFAYLTWIFSVNGEAIAGTNKFNLYRLGSKELLVDDDIMKMGMGETKEFPVTFPTNHSVDELAGKDGVMKVSLLEFKKYVGDKQVASAPSQPVSPKLTEEQKKAAWDENYKSQEIE